MREEWRDIKGYEGYYQVSNTGLIRSLDRFDSSGKFRKGKALKLHNVKGYLIIELWRNCKSKHFTVSRLVADAFISNPSNLPEVNHKDENKHNNYSNNLEWCTAKYNSNYGTRTKRGFRNTDYKARELKMDRSTLVAKLSKAIKGISVSANKDELSFASISEAGRAGFCKNKISRCLHGKQKAHKGYVWEIAS